LQKEKYDFKAAAGEMRKYMGVAGPPNILVNAKSSEKMRNKTLMLSVLSETRRSSASHSAQPRFASGPNEVECERYRAVSLLIDAKKGVTQAQSEQALKEIDKAAASNKIYFATVALEDRKRLSFEDHLKLFQLVPVDFAQLDWILRYTVLTPLSTSVPDAVRQARRQLKQMAKLKIKNSPSTNA